MPSTVFKCLILLIFFRGIYLEFSYKTIFIRDFCLIAQIFPRFSFDTIIYVFNLHKDSSSQVNSIKTNTKGTKDPKHILCFSLAKGRKIFFCNLHSGRKCARLSREGTSGKQKKRKNGENERIWKNNIDVENFLSEKCL